MRLGISIHKGALFLPICILISALSTYQCDEHKITDGYLPRFAAGDVTDSLSNSPLEAALIGGDSLLLNPWSETDSIGHYIAFLGAGSPHSTLFCGKDGYRTKRMDFSTLAQETTNVDFKLAPE